MSILSRSTVPFLCTSVLAITNAITLAVMTGSPPSRTDEDSISACVRTRKLEVVDDRGVTRIRLSCESGKPSAPQIELLDGNQNIRALLNVSDIGASLWLKDTRGNVLAVLGEDGKAAGLSLFTAQNNTSAFEARSRTIDGKSTSTLAMTSEGGVEFVALFDTHLQSTPPQAKLPLPRK